MNTYYIIYYMPSAVTSLLCILYDLHAATAANMRVPMLCIYSYYREVLAPGGHDKPTG